MGGPASLAELLADLFARRGWRRRYLRERALMVWPECVGPEIARHARPAGWQGDALRVDVDHPVWAQELSFLRAEIVARLNARLGEAVVGDLRLHVRPVRPRRPGRAGAAGEEGGGAGPPGHGAPSDGAAPEDTAEPPLPPRLAEALAAVEDEELQRRLARCLSAWSRTPARCGGCGAPLATDAGRARRGPARCAACRLEEEPGGLWHRLKAWLAEHPWSGDPQVLAYFPGLDPARVRAVRGELAQEWRRRLHALTVGGGPRARDRARALAFRYVMLVTGSPPSALTEEDVARVLGPLGGIFGAPASAGEGGGPARGTPRARRRRRGHTGGEGADEG